jgi:hypothetical protein
MTKHTRVKLAFIIVAIVGSILITYLTLKGY